jgi:hypothetical protein
MDKEVIIRIITGGIIVGIVATLITGALNTTPNGLVGAAWHGWPMAWMYSLVIHPPVIRYSYRNLLLDILFWFFIELIVSLVLVYVKKGGKKQAQ